MLSNVKTAETETADTLQSSEIVLSLFLLDKSLVYLTLYFLEVRIDSLQYHLYGLFGRKGKDGQILV